MNRPIIEMIFMLQRVQQCSWVWSLIRQS